ncbi:hypothetical protein Btru_068442 [Bulinus truncatus]|nr:hypothetical protein Btru_068442 [Bulinus truncatus]
MGLCHVFELNRALTGMGLCHVFGLNGALTGMGLCHVFGLNGALTGMGLCHVFGLNGALTGMGLCHMFGLNRALIGMGLCHVFGLNRALTGMGLCHVFGLNGAITGMGLCHVFCAAPPPHLDVSPAIFSFEDKQKHRKLDFDGLDYEDSTIVMQPEFLNTKHNITVREGEMASLPCAVRNLGTKQIIQLFKMISNE